MDKNQNPVTHVAIIDAKEDLGVGGNSQMQVSVCVCVCVLRLCVRGWLLHAL